jgi:hypothetical protein
VAPTVRASSRLMNSVTSANIEPIDVDRRVALVEANGRARLLGCETSAAEAGMLTAAIKIAVVRN